MDEVEKIKKEKLKKLMKRTEVDKMETKIEVNDADFKQNVIEKSKTIPVVVDFWAEWCMPCMILGPVLEKIAKEYAGKFILAKVNLEKNQQKAQEYNVRSIPNVKFFKNGKIIDELIGALPENEVKQWLDKNI